MGGNPGTLGSGTTPSALTGPLHLLRSSWPGARRVLVAAGPLAAVGLLLFGVLHALLIVPIWGRLAAGAPAAFLAAICMALAYSELSDSGRLPQRAGGLVFGLGVWLSLLPVTAFGAFLRLSGLRQRLGALEVALEVLVAFATGGAVGWWLLGRRSSVLRLGACCVAVLLAMAGPVAVTNGRRPTLLFLAFLPLYLAAGILLGRLAGFAAPAPRAD
jgi:hypothetical protein